LIIYINILNQINIAGKLTELLKIKLLKKNIEIGLQKIVRNCGGNTQLAVILIKGRIKWI